MSLIQIHPPRFIWTHCRQCTRLRVCEDPFPASGRCPHPTDHVLGPVHDYVREPSQLEEYEAALAHDGVLASIYLRWVRGLRVTENDFLAIRARTVRGVDEDLAHEPLALLADILGDHLVRVTDDFATYYRLPDEQVLEQMSAAVAFAVKTAFPLVLSGTTRQGADWVRHLLDVTILRMWQQLVRRQLDTRHLDDPQFRVLFEREWEDLLRYQGNLYDFRVVPKLSYSDFVRYQGLPKGKPEIRAAISVYMTHQARAYPHFLKAWFGEVVEQQLGRRLRTMYTPLVEAVVDEALRNLHARGEAVTRMRADLLAEVWEEYDRNWQRFRFYWVHLRKRRPFGYYGLVDFIGNRRAQERFDQLMAGLGLEYRSHDVMEVGFALYLDRQLRRWSRKRYPPDPIPAPEQSLDEFIQEGDEERRGDQVADRGGWNADPEIYPREPPAIIGPDGTPYLNIQQAARRYGTTVHRLRRLDGRGTYRAVRAGELTGCATRLRADARVYAAIPEADRAVEIALSRASTHSSRLRGQELNRKQAAAFLGVPTSTLESWERSGKVRPRREGRVVVYDAAALAQARQLQRRD